MAEPQRGRLRPDATGVRGPAADDQRRDQSGDRDDDLPVGGNRKVARETDSAEVRRGQPRAGRGDLSGKSGTPPSVGWRWSPPITPSRNDLRGSTITAQTSGVITQFVIDLDVPAGQPDCQAHIVVLRANRPREPAPRHHDVRPANGEMIALVDVKNRHFASLARWNLCTFDASRSRVPS